MSAILLLAAIFSALAALMAFLISYAEYERHFDRRQAVRIACHAAVITLCALFVLTVAAGALMTSIATTTITVAR